MPIPSVALRTTDLLLGQNVLYCKSCLLLGPVNCSSKRKISSTWLADRSSHSSDGQRTSGMVFRSAILIQSIRYKSLGHGCRCSGIQKVKQTNFSLPFLSSRSYPVERTAKNIYAV